MPKCEIFDRSDFYDFYTIKPFWVGDFRAKILTSAIQQKRIFLLTNVGLEVPKCEIFDRSDFYDFYTIKPFRVGDFPAKI